MIVLRDQTLSTKSVEESRLYETSALNSVHCIAGFNFQEPKWVQVIGGIEPFQWSFSVDDPETQQEITAQIHPKMLGAVQKCYDFVKAKYPNKLN